MKNYWLGHKASNQSWLEIHAGEGWGGGGTKLFIRSVYIALSIDPDKEIL